MRRRSALVAAASTLCGCAGLVVPGDRTGIEAVDGWPTYRSDAARSGSVGAPSPAVRTPARRWRTSFPSGDRHGCSHVGPAVALVGDATWLLDPATGDHLGTVADRGDREEVGPPVTADGDLLMPGESALFRLDPTVGRRRWTADLGEANVSCLEGHCTPGAVPVSPPSVADGRAVLVAPATGTPPDPQWAVHAVALEDGSVAWERSVGPLQLGAAPPVPVAHRDTVYVQVGDGRSVAAYDLADGTPLRTPTPSGTPAAPGGRFRPLVAGDLLVHGRRDGAVVGVGTDDGTERWRCAFASVAGRPGGVASLASDGARVYLTHNTLLAAVDLRTGEAVWSVRSAQGRFTLPAVADGTVYVGRNRQVGAGPTRENEVFAYDAATGTRRWGWRSSVKGTVGDVVVGPGGVYVPFTTGVWKHREEDEIPTPTVGVTCLCDASTVTASPTAPQASGPGNR